MTSMVTERVPEGAVVDAARGGMSACRGRVTACWVDALATRLGVVIGLAGAGTQRRRCRNDAHRTTWLPQRRGWLGVWAAAVEGWGGGSGAGGWWYRAA